MTINISELEGSLNQPTLQNEDQAAKAISGSYNKYEDLLIRAYSINDESDGDFSKVAEALVGKTKAASIKDVDTLQMVAKNKFERAQRVYTAFTQIMSTTHQLLLNIINKIGK